MNKPIRILSLPVDEGGCGSYRVRQPFEMIHRFTDSDAYIIDNKKDDMLNVARALGAADIIIARPGAPIEGTKKAFSLILERMSEELKQEQKLKAKWVLDIDDNSELISPYSVHYDNYGVEEYFDSNKQVWLWKDGENDFHLEDNRKRLADHIQDIKDADAVTVTTPRLQEYVSEYNRNVFLHPNAINFERWWKVGVKKARQMRVGWSGGLSHYEDWHSIKGPLNKLLREYRFKLVMAGADFSGLIDEDLRDLVEVHDWVPFKGHSYRMMCMNLDVAIIPLADLPFNHYKSNIKWYEFAAMQVPCVVANVEPYNTEIVNMETGLLYSNAQEFETAVLGLLRDSYLRNYIANGAHKWVKSNRDSVVIAQQYLDNLKTLVIDNDK